MNNNTIITKKTYKIYIRHFNCEGVLAKMYQGHSELEAYNNYLKAIYKRKATPATSIPDGVRVVEAISRL